MNEFRAQIRKCSNCFEFKPLTEFYRKRDGHQYRCKVCQPEVARSYARRARGVEDTPVNVERDERGAHLWKPPGERRGRITDVNAYNRMKRFLDQVLEEAGISLQIGKARWEDDTVVIQSWKFEYVPEAVLQVLSRNRIEYTAKRGTSGMYDEPGPGIFYVMIPVDQEACPPGGRRRAKEYA
jgi:hypothetical protein